MSDVTLFCPACNRKLRVPESELGQTVQCPLCSVVFTAPVRQPTPARQPEAPAPAVVLPAGTPGQAPSPASGAAPAPSQGESERRLVGPAIGLLITGFVSLLAASLNAAMVWVLGPEGIAEMTAKLVPRGGAFEQLLQAQAQGPEQRVLQTVMSVGFLVLTLLILCGALQMVRLRMYPLALIASIAALVNVQNCCCLLTAPFGLWALMVLLQPEVRNAFK